MVHGADPADFPETMGGISATGMNALELEQNVQLSDFAPKNLNADPTLPVRGSHRCPMTKAWGRVSWHDATRRAAQSLST